MSNKKRIKQLERRIDELERQVAELEARPVWYPDYVYPSITWPYTTTTATWPYPTTTADETPKYFAELEETVRRREG
jgi:hypothetical protein